MTVIGWGRVRAASLLSTTVMSVTLPAAAYAYTAEQEQACTNDAFRLCSSEIPDVDRVTACMVRNKAQLSPPCRAQFGPDPAAETASVAASRPLNIRPAKTRKPVSARSHRVKKSGKPDAT
jgi:hypothetical protein